MYLAALPNVKSGNNFFTPLVRIKAVSNQAFQQQKLRLLDLAAVWLYSEVGIPQFEAQSASCATSARAEVAKRFHKLFLAIAQVALRFKENKSFLRFIALRTEKICNSVRIIALRTEKNLVACALLRCALSEVEILRCALSD